MLEVRAGFCLDCCNTGRAWRSREQMHDWFSERCYAAERGEISKAELLRVCSIMADWLSDGDDLGYTIPCPEGCK